MAGLYQRFLRRLRHGKAGYASRITISLLSIYSFAKRRTWVFGEVQNCKTIPTSLRLLPSPLQPIPDDTQLPPKFDLRIVPGLPREGDFSPDDLIPSPSTFRARLTSNERTTPKDHWQDVRLLTFNIECPTNGTLPDLVTGSTLVIYPENSAEDVQAMIDLMSWGNIADEPLEWKSRATPVRWPFLPR